MFDRFLLEEAKMAYDRGFSKEPHVARKAHSSRHVISIELKGDRKMKKTISLMLIVILILIADVAKADFIFGTPTNLGPNVNTASSEGGNGGLSISADGLSLYFDSNRSGGNGGGDLWVATRATKNDDWSAPTNLGSVVNSWAQDNSPSISADGLSLYFSSNRSGAVGGSGWSAMDLWVATRETTADEWGTPSNLGSVVNSSKADYMSYISVDSLSLYFSSERPGGLGIRDLWMTTRATTNDDWSEPVNLGPAVNTSSNERRMWISSDGLMLMFQSDRPRTSGYVEIYMTTRATTNDDWAEPVKLGPPVNKTSDISPIVSSDGSTLYFSSYNRDGGYGVWDLWQVSIDPIVDLNGDGIVDTADMCIIVDHWGTDDPLCDIGPMPWGDGIVDIQDLIILAEHLFEDDRLIHHWMLDETEGGIAYDSAGDKNAVLHGDPLWQPTSGRIDGALALDGEDDYLTTPFILDPAAGSFCAFAWIKGTERGRAIISQSDSTGFSQLWIGADPSYGRLMTRLMHPPFPPLISDAVITDGRWHHVGLMFDLERLHRYLYVDGVKVAEDSVLVGGVALDGDLFIGVGEGINKATFFSGLIDDVSIYNAALSAEDIERIVR